MTEIKLTDCYTNAEGPALVSGTQALVRLLLEQARVDREAGLDTSGLVSGYPGSPLGGLDLELARAKRFLDEEGIVFQPAVNEELAATALWGSQHLHLYDEADIDGVFSLWYGKGPGLERAMDALRHANQGGVAAKGGMVVAVGDDPTGKSSTLAYQSDQNFVSLGMPYFFPKSVHDIIPMGLEAFSLSRHSGCCVGLKIVVDTADASVVMDMESIRPKLRVPAAEPGPVHVDRHEPSTLREAKLHQIRLPAVKEWQKANPGNATAVSRAAGKTRLAVVAVGKAVPETREALLAAGLDPSGAQGVVLVEVGMPWPMAEGPLVRVLEEAREVLVVEEKRPLVEDQVARLLVARKLVARLSGKTDPDGAPLLPDHGELSVSAIAGAIAARASALGIPATPLEAPAETGTLPAIAARTPYYCAGCPHNSSRKLPGGAIVGMGIGCHAISGFIDPDTITNFTQMGGEGAFWIGRAPFSAHSHAFQNMGDGTHAHSGTLGIRAAVAAGVNTTFKILYNGAVAMTGGQRPEGGLSPDALARQLDAEGVGKVAVVSDTPEELRRNGDWPGGTGFHHRRDIVAVQEALSRIEGVTGLIFVQTCAAELRRGRKRGKLPDRKERLFINEAVCEGCGDCAVKSNCVAVRPVARPEGEKRRIDQTVCNKDYSCLEGFCPSFVSVVAKDGEDAARPPKLPGGELDVPPPNTRDISNIYIAGIGGTGVSTLSAVLVMAARIAGVSAQAVNQTGLSQKNGGVTSQIRFAPNDRKGRGGGHPPLAGRMVRIPPRSADLLLGCDAVVAANDAVLACLDRDRSSALVNARIDPVGVAGVGTGHVVQEQLVLKRLGSALDRDRISLLDTSMLSERLLGATTFANVMLLGVALQRGFLPVGPDALERALLLNGVDVERNVAALNWGRWLAQDKESVLAAAGLGRSAESKPAPDGMTAAEAVEYFADRIREYGGRTMAGRYRETIERAMEAVPQAGGKARDGLGARAALALYRVMAIKDEYEVARLMTDGAFEEQLREAFGTARPVAYHLAPPMLGWIRNSDGRPRKFRFGPWMRWPFLLLRRLAPLRGSWLDPFGYGRDRRRERAFRDRVVGLFGDGELLADPARFGEMLEAVLAVRGYGHVRGAAMDAAEQSLDALAEGSKSESLSEAG